MARKKKTVEDQMDMFSAGGYEDGGLKDEGGTVDPVSGNDVPPGSTQKEVRDDVPAMLSEGEFVFPADVVRYIGLETLMKIRQEAKRGLAQMEAMGQMGNSEEATLPDDAMLETEIDALIDQMDSGESGIDDLIDRMGQEADDDDLNYAEGGVVYAANGYSGQSTSYGNPYNQTSTQQGYLPPNVVRTPSMSPITTTPPLITPPTSDQDLPTAPSAGDLMGGEGTGPNVPTYETKQYIGPNGEIISVTFINGEPFPPIPEGFTPYDPSKIPETATGVPTATVTGDGGDGEDGSQGTGVGTTKVDPVSEFASQYADLDKSGSLKGLLAEKEELNEKMMKRTGLGILGMAFGGASALGLAGLVYNGVKYTKAKKELDAKIATQLEGVLGPSYSLLESVGTDYNKAVGNILADAKNLNPNEYTKEDLQETYDMAIAMGATPATASAIATSSQLAFARGFESGTPLSDYESVVSEVFGQGTGTAATAMLAEQDLGMFDSPEDMRAFYAGTDPNYQALDPSAPPSWDNLGISETDAMFYESMGYSPLAYQMEQQFGQLSASEIAQLNYQAVETQGPSFREPTPKTIEHPTMGLISYDGSTVTQSAVTPSIVTPTTKSPTLSPGQTATLISNTGSSTTITGKTTATGKPGAFIDTNNDGVQQSNERSVVTSSDGSAVRTGGGNVVTSRSQDEINSGSNNGGGGEGGGDSGGGGQAGADSAGGSAGTSPFSKGGAVKQTQKLLKTSRKKRKK